MNTATASRTPAMTTARLDMYVGIHKALRHFMTDTLHRVGRMDPNDSAELARTLGQFEDLMALCVNHIHHENDFVHAAIEARQPGGASRTAGDHVEHFEHIDALRADARALARASDAGRPALALRLYRHLALFVADNFQHMNVEETQNNAALWANYSDAELLELHQRILASLPPSETMEVMRWMIPASSPAERAQVLGGMKAGAPAQAFQAVLDIVRPHLDDAAWDKLARAIGVPQVPGLVNVR
ncbi:hypothetical protein [uncultured Piscinibacter sp.]|uniref:hemerythrin domain-containing protein n=1 Tax=uncultured Piscinibacter sp. TaxID=1131835 RepID=UPI00262DDDE3|nr:hypothetical protein [uncultured Piscinibacter sp.]